MKQITFLLIAMLFFVYFVPIQAQQQKEHKKTIFLDKKQRLYVQDSLPVYLFLSTSPDGKEAVQLKSESTPKYVNPMHFDGYGKHNIVHKDMDHEVEVKFEVYSDGIAPTTIAKLEKATTYHKDGKLYIGKGLEVNLSSNDDMCGVQQVYHSINGAEYIEYSSAFVPEKEQEYSYKYYAVDNVGNVEKAHHKTFFIDLTSPKSNITVNGPQKENILSARSSLEIKAVDELSGVSKIIYTIDNGKQMTYSIPLALTTLSEGEHTITFYATDHVNNKEEANSYAFYIDKTPPIVIEEILGDRFISNGKEFSSGRTKIKLTAIDNKAGLKSIYYSLNGAEYKLYEEPFYMPTKTGTIAIKSYAVDNVMNKSTNAEESSSKLKSTFIDLTGPEMHYTYSGPTFNSRDTVFISSKTKIIFKGNDIESGLNKITYNIDGKGEINYDDAFNVDKDGHHVVSFLGFDNVNNSSRGNFYFNVDNLGPEIFVHFSIMPIGKDADKEIYPGHVVLFLSATDDQVGYDKIFYSINGNAEKLFSGVVNGFQKEQMYKVKIRAFDKLGNESTKEIVFETEGKKPETEHALNSK